MTLLEIEILAWYAACAGDYRSGDFSAPSVRRAIDDFRGDLGLLYATHDGDAAYKITERGRVYIDALKTVPLPVQVWVMPKATPA